MKSDIDRFMADRSRFVLEALQAANHHLSDRDRRAKYTKMAQSAFRFYRGSNHLFWADLGRDPRRQQFGSDRTTIWIQGDLHTDNYGTYENDDGVLVYDLNDFDESVVADYQFDLWRMAISIVLMVRQYGIPDDNGSNTKTDQAIKPLIDEFTESYLDHLGAYRGNAQEKKVVFDTQRLEGPLDRFLDRVEKQYGRQQLLEKWTIAPSEANDASPYGRFNLVKRADKLVAVTEEERQAIAHQFPHYGTTLTGKVDYNPEQFHLCDLARRINAGTGSLGVQRYYALIAGDGPQQERILDIKHQPTPTPYVYMAEGDRQIYDQLFGDNHALRHSVAYRALTNHTDDYLGWMHLTLPDHPPGYFSVRELMPHMEAFDLDTLKKPKDALTMAATWGHILAAAHARADKNFDVAYVTHSIDQEVDKITAGQHQEFRALVRAIAFEYADQVQQDWDGFLAAQLHLG
ncbi:MAG: DUF2252 family protein [Leptolyngbyaceae bacterium]|nr:DUF2252 family protein [Leptolyngbyaceae bacterium]